jgi:hypothetical protein
MPRVVSLITAQKLDRILPDRILIPAPQRRASHNGRQSQNAPLRRRLDGRQRLWRHEAAKHDLSGASGEEHVCQHATEEPQLQERVVLGQLGGMHFGARDSQIPEASEGQRRRQRGGAVVGRRPEKGSVAASNDDCERRYN